MIAGCGRVCGCDGPTAIRRWATNRADWLNALLALPSRDRIRNVLMGLRPEAFQACFRDWIANALVTDKGGPARLVGIDGRTRRRAHDGPNGLGPLHTIRAWARRALAVGPVATEETPNEITAVPQRLTQIELHKALIMIDAMGCQKDIARDLVAGGGDVVIALKDNPPKLSEAIGALVLKHPESELEALEHRTRETDAHGHGRRDARSYFVAQVPADFAAQGGVPVGQGRRHPVRITTHADGSPSDEVRFCARSWSLSSTDADSG